MDTGASYGLLDVVIHMSPPDIVLHNSAYKMWMKKFGPTTKHIFVGTGVCIGSTAFQASTRQTRKLNRIFPTLFPALSVIPSTAAPSTFSFTAHATIASNTGDVEGVRGLPLLKFNLTPHSQHGWAHEQHDLVPITATIESSSNNYSSNTSFNSNTPTRLPLPTADATADGYIDTASTFSAVTDAEIALETEEFWKTFISSSCSGDDSNSSVHEKEEDIVKLLQHMHAATETCRQLYSCSSSTSNGSMMKLSSVVDEDIVNR